MKCLLVFTTVLLFASATSLQSFTVGNFRLEIGDEIRLLLTRDEKPRLQSKLVSPPNVVNEVTENCSDADDSEKLCLSWGNTLRLNVVKADDSCVTINWTLLEGDNLTNCFDYSSVQWFGGPERYTAVWPVQDFNYNAEPYTIRPENNQAVAEPYWLTSDGSSIYVYPEVPLFTDSNNIHDHGLCLIASSRPPYKRQNVSLIYELCQFSDPVSAHKNAVNKYFGKPTDIPDKLMIRYPIFSTWARYKTNIDEQTVLDFMNQIVENKFPLSQIEIDDKWEPCYGSWIFDEAKFPSIKNLTDKLHSLGGRVTLWVYPFINVDCEPYFTEAKEQGRFVKDESGNVEINWWNGKGAAIDFTNETTAQWWVQRTKDMIETSGIDSLKFDAGESGWLPQLPVLNTEDSLYPDIYTTKYVEAVSVFGKFIEVRVGKRSQNLPIFVRMLDKDSKWGLDNGLKSLLVTLLQMNINGYPFVLPDMIGGNVYGSDKVSKELFIRWLEANVFMPSVQFSVVPWDFDNETIEISKKFITLRDLSTSLIVDAAQRSVLDGTPLNPPIWWIAPNDETAHKCNDEYLLGTSLLIAPVLEDGARERDIYLPNGNWLNITRAPNIVITGPQWLRNYSVALDELPLFRRLE